MYVRSVFSFRPVVSVRSRRFYKEDSTKRLLEFLADMPKANSGRIAETQRQRQQISKKSEKYGPSTVYLQVLGSGTRGAPNTLYLSTDHKRYLFNCGESTQRLAHEHKVRLSKLEHIFITSKSWRNIGGLPGLSLTLQDVGVPNITLHGPEGLDTLYNATKRFVIMKDMQVTMAKSSPSEEFEDGIMNVKYVLLRDPYEELLVSESIKPGAKKVKDPLKKEYERFFNDDTDYYKKEAQETPGSPRGRSAEKKKNERVVNKPKSPDPYKKKAEKALLALEKSSKSCTVAYICTLKKRLGTLDLEKCVEFGVKPGPLLGQLKAGLDVVLPDGKIVHSADVKTPDEPGPVFIVLEVPDISYLKEAEFANYFDDGINPLENIPTVVVHFTPPHVFHEAQYQAFVQRFGPTTRHLVVNEQNSCLGSEAVHRTQHKLHLLDPDIFPLLKDVSVPAVWTATLPMPKANSPVRLKGMEELKNKIAFAQFQNIINMEGSCKGDYRPPNSGIEDSDATKIELINARTLTTFHLRPRKHLDRSLEPKLHIQDYIQETMDVDGFVSSLEQFRHLVDGMRYARTANANEYPKVVFLGTGSCIPSKTRNTSSIVVHVNEESSMLLDCGEGTFSQLVRFYGPKRVNAMLRTIKAIYVSHLHADHHIGLIGVLQARRQAFEETNTLYVPAWLFAPGQIVAWLSMYDDQFEPIRQDFSLVPNQNLLTDSQPSSPKDSSSLMTPATLASIGLSALRTCFVSHCPNAFGVCLDIDQHRITYSGDTIPCESLVNLGQGSTLLIHEATMEDELAEEARYKMHSTTTQAIEQGRLMSAKYTVLTHFSQRYARLPRLNANILSGNHSVGIAFDNMQITMNDLELLPHMYPPLQLMFAEHCVEMELRAAHRANKERFAGTKRKHSNSDGVATKIDKTDRPETKTDGERDKTAENVGPETQDGTPQSNLEISNMDVVRTETEIRQKIKRAGSGLTSRDRSVSRSRPPSFRSNLPLRVAGARQRDASRQDVRSVSGSSTPRSISVSRSPPPKRFTRHSNPSSGTCTPKQRCETPERHRDCANPPNTTPSEVSTDISKKRAATPEKPNKAKIHVVDSRSRTFRTHSTDRSSTEEDTKKPAKRINPTPNNYHPPMHSPTTKTVYRAENISHGYGKPIIPMQNRRLSIMKQSHIPVVDDKSTNSSNISNKTIGSNAENRGSNKSSPVHTRNNSRIEVLKHKSQHETSLSKLKQSFLANVVLYAIFWRMSCAVSWFWQERYRWLTPIIAVGVLFWTVTKSISKMAAKSPPMTPPVYGKDRQKSPSSPASPPKSRSGTDTQSYTKIKGRDQKPLGSPVSVSELRHSITKPSTPRVPDRTRNTPVETPDTRPPFKHHIVNDYKQEPKIPCTKRESECPKNCPSNHREATNEILRQQSSKEVKDMRPSPLTSRPTSAASRSFKPQLEDIKSSLLLLKKSGSKTKVLSPPNSVNKPRPLNESERREMLEEARRKFQSRGFFHDAKYDKIEGLNWISWKA